MPGIWGKLESLVSLSRKKSETILIKKKRLLKSRTQEYNIVHIDFYRVITRVKTAPHGSSWGPYTYVLVLAQSYAQCRRTLAIKDDSMPLQTK